MAIPCPTVAPVAAHPRSQWVMCRGISNQLEGPGCWRQMFVLEEHFKGPLGYAGIPGPHGTSPLGHLAIWATRTSVADEEPCASPRFLGAGRLATLSGRWYLCPTGGLNAGHLAFVWNTARVSYGVSVHRNSQVNRRLIERIVARLLMVHGSKPG